MAEQKVPTITLLTDYGTRDGYVASMKGAILSINSSVNIIDISHDIAPQDILEAAFVLRSAFSCRSCGSDSRIHAENTNGFHR